MSVQIIINGESAKEALSELSNLAGGFAPKELEPVEAAVPVETVETTEKTKRTRTTKPADSEPVKQPDPKPETQEEETKDTGDAPSTRSETIASDVVKDKANAWIKAAGDPSERETRKTKVKALLSKYKSTALTTVPEEQRAAFLADLDALDDGAEAEDLD